MKIVYDYDKKCVVKREQEKQFYKDSEFADRIRVYISDPGLPSEQYSYHLAMAFKKPNGRIIAPQYYNGAAGTEAIEIDGISKNYSFFDFNLSAMTGVLDQAGDLEMTCYLNIMKTEDTEITNASKYKLVKREAITTFTNRIANTVNYNNGNVIFTEATDDSEALKIAIDVKAKIEEWETKLQKLKLEDLQMTPITKAEIESACS